MKYISDIEKGNILSKEVAREYNDKEVAAYTCALKMAVWKREEITAAALEWLRTRIPNYSYDFEQAFKKMIEELS